MKGRDVAKQLVVVTSVPHIGPSLHTQVGAVRLHAKVDARHVKKRSVEGRTPRKLAMQRGEESNSQRQLCLMAEAGSDERQPLTLSVVLESDLRDIFAQGMQ